MTATGTLVLDSGHSLAAALELDVSPDSADQVFYLALADATAGHGLTLTWQGSEEGARQTRVALAGDEFRLPLHGITHLTVEADAYPTTIAYGILRAGASMSIGLTRTA